MKAFLISDNIDTLAGLHLSGINGIVLHKKEEILNALEETRKNPEISIIIITELAAALVQEKIREIKLSKKLPLIIEIPDRHGSRKGKDYILKYIQESIGLKIEAGDYKDHDRG
jgi:V/A-type H+/Na+-transporting ATPase subunit F